MFYLVILTSLISHLICFLFVSYLQLDELHSELPDKSKEKSALEMLQVCIQSVIFFYTYSYIL